MRHIVCWGVSGDKVVPASEEVFEMRLEYFLCKRGPVILDSMPRCRYLITVTYENEDDAMSTFYRSLMTDFFFSLVTDVLSLYCKKEIERIRLMKGHPLT